MNCWMRSLGQLSLACALLGPLGLAQIVAPPPPPPPPPPEFAGTAIARDVLIERAGTNVHFIAAEPAFLGKPVTGAPYSAEAVNETTRVLADGTRIQNTTTTRIARDRDGRTRVERSIPLPAGADEKTRTHVTISDPISRKTTILDAASQTARVVVLPPIPPLPVPPDGAEPKEMTWVSESVEGGNTQRNVVIQRRIVVSTSEGAGSIATASPVPPAPQAPPAPHAPPAPPAMMLPSSGMASIQARNFQAHRLMKPDNVTIEGLGERQIEGVQAVGTRRTATIATGAIGNDRPIISVTEEWRSPELQLVLLRSTRDPQIGEITYKLIGISRSEPLKDLFEVPAGYRVIEHSHIETEEFRGPE